LRRDCGLELAATVGITGQSDTATAITKLRAAGVTTVIPVADFVNTSLLTQAADAQDYGPGWFVAGASSLDDNAIAHTMNQHQWAHAFGFSATEMTRPYDQSDCYRASKSVEPDGGPPDFIMCTYEWPALQQFFNGLQ